MSGPHLKDSDVIYSGRFSSWEDRRKLNLADYHYLYCSIFLGSGTAADWPAEPKKDRGRISMQNSIDAKRRPESLLERKWLERRGYLCRRQLGEGAFSRVYWVETVSGGESYACKISENEELLEREARILALLRHPLFPMYYDFWKQDGRGFLLREYVPGNSLEDMLKRRGGFTAGRTIGMGLELARGLGYLHGREERFLFRDIKPSNIILCQNGRLKLVDLGCACSLKERITSRAGSPGFAAPEQLRSGGILTTASDIYGLGQTLRAAFGTGRPEPAVHKRHSGGRGYPKRRGAGRRGRKQKALEAGLWQVLEACTREEAGERIPDMESLERELSHIYVEAFP